MPFAMEEILLECLELAEFTGDETVMVIGLAPAIEIPLTISRLARGKLIVLQGDWDFGIDASALHPRDRTRVELLNLKSNEVELEEAVDRVISIGVMGAYADKLDVYKRLFRALKPGGLFVLDMGAPENMASIWAVARQVIPNFGDHFFFTYQNEEEATRDLISAGFIDINVSIVPAPMEIMSPDLFMAFVKRIFLSQVLSDFPAETADALEKEFFGQLGTGVIDFVRLRVRARRPVS